MNESYQKVQNFVLELGFAIDRHRGGYNPCELQEPARQSWGLPLIPENIHLIVEYVSVCRCVFISSIGAFLFDYISVFFRV